jgi:hypothetical protein
MARNMFGVGLLWIVDILLLTIHTFGPQMRASDWSGVDD